MMHPPLPIRLQHPLPPGTAPEVNPQSVYIVGGSVRDLLLGRAPLDYDLAVAGDPQRFARRLAGQTKGRIVVLGKSDQTIYRVVTPANVFDVSGLGGPTIEADLNRRDFTINAMAVDAATGDIIDVLNSREDLLSGRIQIVSNSVFRQDPIRLVRAFRLAAIFDFRLSAETTAAIQAQASLIARSAGERIWSELLKILETRRSARFVNQMAVCGLLEAILPEINFRNNQPSGHHPSMVGNFPFEAAYSELEKLLIDPSSVIPQKLSPDAWPQTAVRGALLKFALLIQDSATPPHGTRKTQRMLPNEVVYQIYRRLRMSNRQAKYIDHINRHHKKPFALFTAYRKKRLSKTAVTRLFMTSGDILPDLLLNTTAVVAAGSKDTDDHGEKFSEFARDLLQRFYFDFKPLSIAPPYLTGKDLITTFNMKPSPAFKFLLNRIETDRLAGRIHSKSEALDRVSQLLRDRSFET